MEARSWFRLSPAPVGPQFEALLDFAVARRAHYPSFLLVQRPDAPRTAESDELLAMLAPHFTTEIETDRWPGARAHGGTARVRFYLFERHAAVVLARVGSLAQFVPPYPEDLCLLASDKTPWLVSSSRAGRFHLHLTEDEHRAIGKALPWLALQPDSDPEIAVAR